MQLEGLQTELQTKQTRLTGYTDYQDYNTVFLHRTVENGEVSIGVFMASGGSVSRLSRFVYLGTNTNKWQSMVEVKSGTTYYMYGYMPVEIGGTATIEKLPSETDYAQGAKLTLRGISPVSEHDVCVVSGVQQVENATDDEALVAGQYQYTGKPKNQNHVFLMLDHLYASICVDFQVYAPYAELRTIKLKKLALTSTAVGAVDANLSLRANQPYQVSWTTTAGTAASNPFYENDEGLELPTTETYSAATAQKMYGYFVPITDVLGSLFLVSTYDIYDTEGNLLRKDCTSTNQLNTLLSTIKMGDQQPIHLTIVPTYLYQLSDADLESPTFIVEN